MEKYTNEDRIKFLKEIYGDEKPIYIFCPICDNLLEVESIGYFGLRRCLSCDYKYQQTGSYGSEVTINNQIYELDDMFDDSEKLDQKIKELRPT